MIKNAILKNIGKFDVLKMPKGINLQHFQVLRRNPDYFEQGLSTKKYGDVWFKLPKGMGIFKTFDSEYNSNIRQLRIINELICQELCTQIGIRHAEYEPAHIENDDGLISYNVLKENQRLVTLADFLSFHKQLGNNLIDIIEAIEYYKYCDYEIDKEDIIFDLFKIMVLDCITLQSDRHNFNVNFIFDDDKIEITVAPLFDNEYAFNVENFRFIEPNDYLNNHKLLTHFASHSKFLNVESELAYSEKAYRHNIVNLCNLAKSNKQMHIFLETTLNDLSIIKAIKNVESQGYIISTEYKAYLIKLVNFTKDIFKREFLKPKEENTTYLYDEFIK